MFLPIKKKLIGFGALVALNTLAPSYAALDTSIDTLKFWYKTDTTVRAELSYKDKPTQEPILILNNKKVVFNDNGKSGDLKARDGVYSATVPYTANLVLADQIKNAPERDSFDELVKHLVTHPMYEERRVVTDKRQIEHLLSILDNKQVDRNFKVLRELAPELAKIPTKELLAKLEIDPQMVPLVELQPRKGMDTLVNIIGMPVEVFASVLPGAISVPNSLMITHPNVVKDSTRTFNVCTNTGRKGGVWTFSYLMKKLSMGVIDPATGVQITPEAYTLKWLHTWFSNQTVVTGYTANARPNIQMVINSWKAASPNGILNIDHFPAVLMGIVNRPDIGLGVNGIASLYDNTQGELKRGETRLVFVLVDKNNQGFNYGDGDLIKPQLDISIKPPKQTCQTIPFTVIFEYNNAVSSCIPIRDWQKRWFALGNLPLGGSSYNSALASITTSIVNNKKLLAHLRTNEIALANPWEMREFVLGKTGLLSLDPVDGTPDESLNNTAAIPSCLTNNPSCEDASSPTPSSPTPIIWDSPNFPTPFQRHKFAMTTCSGCHAAETATDFTHIGWSGTAEFRLSRFLTGNDNTNPLITVGSFNSSENFNPFSKLTDNPTGDNPVANNQFTSSSSIYDSNSNVVIYNDLARRQGVMADIVSMSCKEKIIFHPDILPIKSSNFEAIH